jgi:hypothetical protein
MATFFAVAAIAASTACGGASEDTVNGEASPTTSARSSPTLPPQPTPTTAPQPSIKNFTIALTQTSGYRCDPSSACPPPPGIICDADFQGTVSGDIEGAVSGTAKSAMTERDPAITLTRLVAMSDCTLGEGEGTLSSSDGSLAIQYSGTMHYNFDTGVYTADLEGTLKQADRELPIRCRIEDGVIAMEAGKGTATLACVVE